jgi:hypothetical protein
MEGSSSRVGMYRDTSGALTKNSWDEQKTPVFRHRGYVSLREMQVRIVVQSYL